MIGIINTWSDINPCHTHLRQRAEDVKRGVLQAGGFPIELPAMSLAEVLVKPTTMLYRNFLAMETEELLRSHPIDGAVLIGGCDKTTPGLIMGAISMGLPAIYVPAGPMLRGNWHGKTLGSGSDVWKYWDEKRAGNITEADWDEIENGIARSFGTCMTMGTAATMMAIAEAMGLTLPGASSIPAADANHPRMATRRGRRIVEMVWEDLTPEKILDAGRVRQRHQGAHGDGRLDQRDHPCGRDGEARRRRRCRSTDFDRISRTVPVIANVRPSGEYLMEDFFYAGGLRALMKRAARAARSQLHDGDRQDRRREHRGREGPPARRDPLARAIRSRRSRATGVLFGNLAPRGASSSRRRPRSACSSIAARRSRSRTTTTWRARSSATISTSRADHVLVLKNAGPKGGPGMPEWGMLPIPRKLVKQGVRDMLRISDARMSGTSYGACVLHVSPESYVGGPLAFVQTGDQIEVDVAARTHQSA